MILENLNVAISNNFISPFPPPPLQSHDRFHTRPTRIVFRCHKIIGIPHYITRDYGCIIIIRGKVGGQAGKLMADVLDCRLQDSTIVSRNSIIGR